MSKAISLRRKDQQVERVYKRHPDIFPRMNGSWLLNRYIYHGKIRDWIEDILFLFFGNEFYTELDYDFDNERNYSVKYQIYDDSQGYYVIWRETFIFTIDTVTIKLILDVCHFSFCVVCRNANTIRDELDFLVLFLSHSGLKEMLINQQGIKKQIPPQVEEIAYEPPEHYEDKFVIPRYEIKNKR